MIERVSWMDSKWMKEGQTETYRDKEKKEGQTQKKERQRHKKERQAERQRKKESSDR